MSSDDMAIPRLSLFSRQQCETIHRASLEILRRTGVRVYHPGALDLLRQTDAVITDDNLVQFPPGLVEWALRQAPSRVSLCRRGSSDLVAPLEGRSVNFGPGSDCPNYLDPHTGERRRFSTADVTACIHVVDALPELSFCMSMGIPSDLGTANAYRQQFALMLEHTTKPIVFVCDDRADCEAIAAMASAAAGGMDQLRLNPTLLLYSEPSTPLKHTESATAKLLYMAEQGLPIVHSPAPMMGGTAPVTLAGGLTLGNAEVLSSLVMHQLKRPGAPFVYGSGLHHMDMKTTISVYGAPEFQLARVAVAELGRFYDLPTWGYAGHSDSCAMDEQAAADAAFSVLVALLAGNNLVHDIGYLEAGSDHLARDDRLYCRDDLDDAPLWHGDVPGCRIPGTGGDPPGRSRRRFFDGPAYPQAFSRAVAAHFAGPPPSCGLGLGRQQAAGRTAAGEDNRHYRKAPSRAFARQRAG